MQIKVRSLFLVAMGIFVIGVSMFLLIFFRGQELLPHQIVFVPNGGVKLEEHTQITGQNFKALLMPKEVLAATVSPNMITLDNMEVIMNKTLVMPLYADDAITLNHVREDVLVPRQGENEYPIPASWLEVMDWTGRSGDEAEIWLFPTNQLKQQYTTKSIKDTRVETNIQPVPDTEERPLKKPILDSVRLRYVVDGTNRSVKNATEAQDRSDATGEPVKMKANLKPEQYAQLKGAVEEGYKLIVVAKGVLR